MAGGSAPKEVGVGFELGFDVPKLKLDVLGLDAPENLNMSLLCCVFDVLPPKEKLLVG